MNNEKVLDNVRSWVARATTEPQLHVKHVPWCNLITQDGNGCTCDGATTAITCYIACNERRNAAEAKVCELTALVIQLRSRFGCALNVHGFCTAHDWLSKEPCPHSRALKF